MNAGRMCECGKTTSATARDEIALAARALAAAPALFAQADVRITRNGKFSTPRRAFHIRTSRYTVRGSVAATNS